MHAIPKIVSVTAIGTSQLLVCFDSGAKRRYDCSSLIQLPWCQLLKVPAFFRAVRVDVGGHGVIWNDDMDLSEYELWTNGEPVADVIPETGGVCP